MRVMSDGWEDLSEVAKTVWCVNWCVSESVSFLMLTSPVSQPTAKTFLTGCHAMHDTAIVFL